MPRYDVVAFDFDGTLVDTREVIVRSLGAVLAEHGFAVPAEAAIWRHVGRDLPQVLAELTGLPAADAGLARLREAYLARFDAESPGRTRIIDGIVRVLGALRAGGVRLAIATNRGRPSLELILREHALHDVFGCLVTATCVANAKPAPDMLENVLRHFGADKRRTLMVGDTTVDLRMGRAAGVDTCAVTYGAHPAEDLLREQPTHIVHRASELVAVVEGTG